MIHVTYNTEIIHMAVQPVFNNVSQTPCITSWGKFLQTLLPWNYFPKSQVNVIFWFPIMTSNSCMKSLLSMKNKRIL